MGRWISRAATARFVGAYSVCEVASILVVQKPCRIRRRLVWRWKFVAAVVLLIGALVFVAAPAGAHSFLVRTTPASGERLDVSPGQVVLDFSGAVEASARLQLRSIDGTAVGVLFVGVDKGGLRLLANLPALSVGVYDVAWAVRAFDGHQAEGEFAFAVGRDVPPGLLVGSIGPTGAGSQWGLGVALGVTLAGLLAAFGGLVSEVFIWRRWSSDVPRSFALPALLVAEGGAAAAVTVRLRPAGSSWRPWRWSQDLVNAHGFELLVVLMLVAGAGLLIRLRLPRAVAAAMVAVAAGLVVWNGHVSVGGRWWTSVAVAHVVFAGVWFGSLAHLARVARVASGEITASGADRYASAAFVSLLAVAVAGVSMSLRLLHARSDLWGTAYGRVLSVKLMLVIVTVGLAVTGRRWGLPTAATRVGVLRTATRWEACSLAGVVFVSGVLGATSPPSPAQRLVLAAAPIPADAQWSADLAGSYLVLAGAAKGRLRVDVVAPGGVVPRDVILKMSAVEPSGTEIDVQARSCGPGCAAMNRAWQSGITTVVVTLSGGEYGDGTVRLPVSWPAGPDASELLARALVATRAVESLEVTETVDSGSGAISGPYTLTASGRLFVEQQPYVGGGDGVHRLADQDGLMTLSFVVRGSNTWVQLWVSPDDLRIVRSRVVDPGHRVTHDLKPQ